MRKHTARHWLHAVLDLLPVLLIPVFMIYSHRHDMTQQTEVDIQYKYQSNEVNNINDIICDEYHIYHLDSLILLNQDFESFNDDFEINIVKAEFVEVFSNDLSIDEIYISNYENKLSNYIYIYISDSYQALLRTTNNDAYTTLAVEYQRFELINIDFYISSSSFLNYFTYFEILPTYSEYNVIESVDVHDETSSVMNVFMDNFNTAIDKYFNMGNVFGMTNVYQWFNTNIFGGNAPTIIFSVWNIVLYEFVMDLIFLLYALFMWFIDMTKRLIEKPLDSIK